MSRADDSSSGSSLSASNLFGELAACGLGTSYVSEPRSMDFKERILCDCGGGGVRLAKCFRGTS